MKYCAECGSEYLDTATECADCGSKEFGSAEELRKKGIPLLGERDTRKFVRAGSAEDPLTSQRLVAALDAEGIPVFARPRRGGTVDIVTSGAGPWWEILVPEEHLARATDLVDKEKAQTQANAEENARAAEEEEAEGEAQKS